MDNGAWRAFQQGVPFDEKAFEQLVAEMAVNADWVAAPDIVAGGKKSLELSLPWVERLLQKCRVLIPVQDGMKPEDVADHLGPDVGIFIGGSTEFKEQTAREWGVLAAERGCWLHVGRVNSKRRIEICAEAGATSFDGSAASRFSLVTEMLTQATMQPSLLAPRSGPVVCAECGDPDFSGELECGSCGNFLR